MLLRLIARPPAPLSTGPSCAAGCRAPPGLAVAANLELLVERLLLLGRTTLATPDVRRQVLSARLTVTDRRLEPRRGCGSGLRRRHIRVCDTGQDQDPQAAGERQNAPARFEVIGYRRDLLLRHQ